MKTLKRSITASSLLSKQHCANNTQQAVSLGMKVTLLKSKYCCSSSLHTSNGSFALGSKNSNSNLPQWLLPDDEMYGKDNLNADRGQEALSSYQDFSLFSMRRIHSPKMKNFPTEKKFTINSSRILVGGQLLLNRNNHLLLTSSVVGGNSRNYSKMMGEKRRVVGAIDQGTTSTRFMLFDASDMKEVASYQILHENHFPKPGWVEQDPIEIYTNTIECMTNACEKLEGEDYEIIAIGVTNQRETTVLWDSETGKPLCKSIVWNDTRTKDLVDSICKSKAGGDYSKFREVCGLPLSTYFSAVKLRWMIDHYEEVKNAVERGTCMFGTVDSWLIWNLTGGTKGGIHITDVTNASRTMLMNLKTLKWDNDMLNLFEIPSGVKLPTIKSSAEVYSSISKDVVQNHPLLRGVAIAGCIGDQQSATIGQKCFKIGDTKNTYGTGCFLLMNCGNEIVKSTHGLLSTVQYQLGPNTAPVYALEGSVAVCGSGISWLEHNLKLIENPAESETLARTVEDTGGVVFVPAFSGLYCPYWRSDARGTIVGITHYTNSAHIVRAMLEAVCFQTQEVLESMVKDSGLAVTNLMVDGGMTKNQLLMQLQSDISRKKVKVPSYSETTVLGAAICAAFGVGHFKEIKDIPPSPKDKMLIFTPHISEQETELKMKRWKKAIEKSLNWHEE